MSPLVLSILLIAGLLCACGVAADPFLDIFGETLYKWSESGTEVHEYNTSALLKNKDSIAVYFSASWCGPCKKFTPQLAQFYKEMNKKGKKFEVVWVSRDQTEEEFVEYFSTMPWLAVTIDNIPKCLEKTAQPYQVRGIPHLVILDGYDGSVITLDGRTKVLQDQYGLEFPWRPRTPGTLLKQFLPRSVRSLVGAQVQSFKNKLRAILRGALQRILPVALVNRIFGAV